MNIIDMVAICPFYISLILEGLEDFEIIGKTGKMIRLVGGTKLINNCKFDQVDMRTNKNMLYPKG